MYFKNHNIGPGFEEKFLKSKKIRHKKIDPPLPCCSLPGFACFSMESYLITYHEVNKALSSEAVF
jgi:hypothetical protein